MQCALVTKLIFNTIQITDRIIKCTKRAIFDLRLQGIFCTTGCPECGSGVKFGSLGQNF